MGLRDFLALLFSPKVPDITPDEAYAKLRSEPESTIILDVRQPLEYRSGRIPDATLVPMTQLGQRLAELPSEQTILTICRSSHRSPIAARRLRAAGYDVLNVAGGMLAWEKAGLPIEK